MDEKVFSNLKTTAGNTAVFDNNGTAETTSDHTGVLLGLRAPNRHSSMEDCYHALAGIKRAEISTSFGN